MIRSWTGLGFERTDIKGLVNEQTVQVGARSSGWTYHPASVADGGDVAIGDVDQAIVQLRAEVAETRARPIGNVD